MTTAHSKRALLDAHERLREMFDRAGTNKLHPIYNAQGEIVGHRHPYENEMEILKCGDVPRVRQWARDYRPWPNYAWPDKKIRIAVQFLASACERVGTVEVTEPIDYTEHGEYAGDNTNLTIRPGCYPIVRCQRYGGDSKNTTYALVVVDGVNYFVNRIGALSKVRKTAIMEERRMWDYSTDSRAIVLE